MIHIKGTDLTGSVVATFGPMVEIVTGRPGDRHYHNALASHCEAVIPRSLLSIWDLRDREDADAVRVALACERERAMCGGS